MSDAEHDVCAEMKIVSEATGVQQDYASLKKQINQAAGWRMNFTNAGERVLSQAASQGGTLIFNSYLPNSDPCQKDGRNRLWALDVTTGTPECAAMIGSTGSKIQHYRELPGAHMATPVIQVNGSKNLRTYSQTPAGFIETNFQSVSKQSKSEIIFWKKSTK